MGAPHNCFPFEFLYTRKTIDSSFTLNDVVAL